jgi:hypothetical protein
MTEENYLGEVKVTLTNNQIKELSKLLENNELTLEKAKEKMTIDNLLESVEERKIIYNCIFALQYINGDIETKDQYHIFKFGKEIDDENTYLNLKIFKNK